MTDAARSPRRLRRAVASGALAALAATTSGGAAAANVVDPPAPMPIEHLCGEVPDTYHPFGDVGGSVFRSQTVCLAYARITQGSAGSRYEPDTRVTRQQMASFIARMMDSAAELDLMDGIVALPAWDGRNRFSDVAEGSAHVGNINRLAAAGIALGGPGGAPADRYGPTQAVSRAQMATFVARALAHLAGGIDTPDADHFPDDAGNAHETNINLVAEYGIAVGGGSGGFGPAASLTRGQMSAFLMRSLAALEFAAFIPPLPATEG